MKYNYNKPNIEISNWLVNQQDIEKVISFFKDRFLITEIPISLDTETGNNRQYDTYSEFVGDLPKLATDQEKVTRIEISYRSHVKENSYHFKQTWIQINFGKYGSARWWVIAGDTDGTYKDWVAGTYSEMQRLSKLFEVHDEKTIDAIRKRFNTGIVFDPDGSVADSIQAQLNNDIQILPSDLSEALSGGEKYSLWNKITNNQTFAFIFGTLIVAVIFYLIYKYSGVNLSNF